MDVLRAIRYRMRARSRTARSFNSSNITVAHLVLITWCAFRVAVIGKAMADIPGLPAGNARVVSWYLLALVIVESLAILTVLVRTSALPGYVMVGIDAATSAVVSIGPALPFDEVEPRLLPWHFALVFTSVCLVAMRVRSTTVATALVVGLTAAYLLGRYLQDTWSSPAIGITRGFTVAMVLAVGAAFCRHLMALSRRMETLIESNVKLAARVAVANERATQRVFLHDTAGLLAMIANTEDPELSAVLRERARSTSKELRSYVYEERVNEAAASRPLDQIVGRVAKEFRDLPIDQNTLLAKHVFLTGDEVQALESALRTLLDNVRVHAHARNVTIHARSTGAGWEVTVRDDGVGFDPATVRKGFGLREQVETQCALASIAVNLNSHPGEGTEVRLICNSLSGSASSSGANRRSRGNFKWHWRTSRRGADPRG